MNFTWILLAALGGTVAYFAFGGIVFVLLPVLRNEYKKSPAVYRSRESMMSVFPIGMLAIFVAIVVLAVIYSQGHSFGPAAGARFGALVGLFVICAFVLHNHVNLNVSWRLTAGQAVAYFAEWTVVGVVIGSIY